MVEFDIYKETELGITRIVNSLIDNERFIHSPEIVEKIKEFRKYLESNPHENIKPKAIKPGGDFFDMEEIKSRILRITGYHWDVVELVDGDTVFEYITTAEIEYSYNISLGDDDIKIFEFRRQANTRDELYSIIIVLMPGYVFAEWDTQRVSGNTKLHGSIDGLMEELNELF